jgi:type I restriction enzyme S subunit
LEEQAKALFKSWFIDFEPFKGGKFVESELGEIPEEWKVVNLLDVSVLFDKRRKPLSGQQRQKMEKLYPYYGATSVMDYVDDYIFNGVYLLMGEDGSVVKSNGSPYLQYVSGKFWPNNHAHVMQGKNGYSTEMLWCLLDLTNVSSIVTGAVQGKISQQSMQKIMVPLPTQEVCDRFNIIINPIFAEIRLLSESSMWLSALRDTLLPKLMSGEIDVEHSKLLFI